MNWTPSFEEPKFWISFELANLDWVEEKIDWDFTAGDFAADVFFTVVFVAEADVIKKKVINYKIGKLS